MPIKTYQKLIRDKIPQFFAGPNKVFNTKVLDDSDFKVALRQKLLEESKEVLIAANKEDLINEIADILEVLNYLKSAESIADDEIETCRLHKKGERGGFDQKLFLESVEEK